MICCLCQLIGQNITLTKPSKVQYFWQEQERIMFIHFGIATWRGTELDQGNFDLKRVNPSLLSTDEWCRIAKSWGAKEIIFVAKHVGAFCWWPTKTTEYCVRNIPWKGGKGDLVADISKSCKKFGINLGIYCKPEDIGWGAGIGSGGKTSDPSKQEAYNKVYRQQLTELLSNYGDIKEVWFDGGCAIYINDIIEKFAKEAVIFQGPKASIRWPGTETGCLFYPAWNTVKSNDLKTGVSTQYHDDPNGDSWAPLEADVPLYNHYWFWSPGNEEKRKSVDELMNIYYKSIGYGGVLLLNSSPDTMGVIPEGDMKRYSEFGEEINRRFSKPLKTIKNKKGKTVELIFEKPIEINHTIIMEDYHKGQSIREYVIEGQIDKEWKILTKGSSVGRKKIDPFSTVKVLKVRLRVIRSVDIPLIRSFEVYNVDNYQFIPDKYETVDWKECGLWDTKSFNNGKGEISVDLSPYIIKPGQYEVAFTSSVNITGMRVDTAEIIFESKNTMSEYLTRKKNDFNTFYINQPYQVIAGSNLILKVKMSSNNKVFQNKGAIKIRPRSTL